MATKFRILVGSVLVVALAAPAAFAGPAAPGARVRQTRQHVRIHQGVVSGELTRAEAQGLRIEERALQREKQAMRADGTLSPAERARLQNQLDGLSSQIHEEKHDGEKRP